MKAMVLDIENGNVKALYRRAQAYIQQADLDLAEFDIKKALEIDPNNSYDLNSTKEERVTVKNQKRKEYEKLRRQCRRLLRHSDGDSGSITQDMESYSSEDVV